MTAPGAAPGPEAEQDAGGVRTLVAEDFSLLASVGGARGALESMLPGLVFVVVYVLTRELRPTLWASLGVAAVLVVARLVTGSRPVHALSGLLGVGVGVVWAALSGRAENYFAAGLWTNAAYLLVCVVSIAARWPAVGVVVELLRSGLGAESVAARRRGLEEQAGPDVDPHAEPPALLPRAWRSDAHALRRYAWATAAWAGMFALRLAVQVPLYLTHDVGWLGTARLVMGLPLWALTLWVTWLLLPYRRVSSAEVASA